MELNMLLLLQQYLLDSLKGSMDQKEVLLTLKLICGLLCLKDQCKVKRNGVSLWISVGASNLYMLGFCTYC